MHKVTVNLDKRSYDIKIEKGLLAAMGKEARKLSKAGKAAIITDANVDSLYGAKLQKTLEESDFIVRYRLLRVVHPFMQEWQHLV